MTYIKQIELENFKSFAGHTKFDFTKGFNAIAGANGSGKSNIIDATMFVLGGTSKKEMRSELLTDLIFNGGKNGKPAEFAKVTVVMDNSDKSFSNFDDKEISISRKVDRNGKSVYRVNGRASTREEILNILSIVKVKQDSFNIVPQGKILEVIGYSAEDRLRIINDISGISVFEDKKSKAMNEMKKVESNISKIDTILNEKKKLMEQLEKERTKAIEFKELKGRQENLLAKQILIRRNSIAGDLEVIQGKIGSIDGDNKKLSEELGELNLKITSNRKEIDRINTQAESQGEQEISNAEKSSRDLDGELTRLKTILNTDKAQLSRVETSLKEVLASKDEVAGSIDKENSEIKSVREKYDELNSKKLKLTESALASEKYLKDKGAYDRRLNDIEKQVYEYKLALANYPKVAELQANLSDLTESKHRIDSDKKELTLKFSDIKPEVDKLKSSIKKESDQLYWLRENLLSSRSSILNQSRATELADRFRKEINGVFGTVGELFTVKEQSHSDSIFRSIGRRSEFVVVDNEDTAKSCIDRLKSQKLGSLNFIPLNKIYAVSVGEKPQYDFVIDYTINLVNFDQRFVKAMQFVFGDTVLVSDFEPAKSLIGKYRMVTIDGTVTEKTGVISGGHFESSNISTITKKIADLNKQIEEHTNLKEKYESELIEKESSMSYIMSQLKTLEKGSSELTEKISRITKEKSKFSGSESEISEMLTKLENEKAGVLDSIKKLEVNKPDIVDHKREIEQMEKDTGELRVKLNTSTNRIENVFERELDNITRRSLDLEKESERFVKEIERVEAGIAEVGVKLEKSKEELAKKSQSLVSLRKRRDELTKEISQLEQEKDKYSNKENELFKELNGLRIKEAELKAKLEAIDEEYGKHKIPDLKIEEGETLEKITKELNSVSSKVNSFGPINELALEKFETTEKEYNEFNEKLTRLSEERDKIMEAIADIEKKKLESFMKTLTEINSIFSKVFNSITSGHAELVPDNQENVFAGGLDVTVDLPNKKVHNIRGLSGGELSVLSISLLLAVSKYTDVSFYMLDEVDAALDSFNASKFSGLIKSYADNAQFIIISHNDSTLINSDVIYGVTMTNEGMSKVVSVKMPKEETAASPAKK